MILHPAGTFEYAATVDQDSMEIPDPLLQATERRGSAAVSLVGPSPRILLGYGRIAIVASSQHNASVWKASFSAGDALLKAWKANDQLYLSRSSSGEIGISLLSEGSLVLAFGSATCVPLVSRV